MRSRITNRAKAGVCAACAAAIVVSTSGVAGAGTLKVMLTGKANNSLFNKVIAEYQKLHTGTKIVPIYMQWEDQAAAIAKKPDVYIGGSYFLSDNIDIGIFEDLNKMLPAKSVSEFLPELLASCSIGKQIYGVPVFGFASCLVYNKGSFKDSGLTAPDSSWTWEGKFYEACRKLSRGGSGDGASTRYGFVGLPSQGLQSLFYSYGGTITDKSMKKVTYTEKPGMDAINLILKMHQEKIVEFVDWSTVTNEDPKTYPFNNGKSAMDVTWGINMDPADYNKWFKQQKIAMEVGMGPLPSGPKGAVSPVFSEVAAMMVTCKNKKEAAEFLKFMASLKGQELLYDVGSGLPTTESGLRLAKVTKKVPAPLLKTYRAGKGSSLRKQVGQISGQLWGDLRNIVAGEGTLQDLKDNAKGKATEVLTMM